MRGAAVVTGVRQPRGTPARAAQTTKFNPGLYARVSAFLRSKGLIQERAEKSPYEVVFASRASRLRIQITAPEDVVDSKTGRKTRGRPICAQFDRGLWSIPKNVRGQKITPEMAAEMLSFMREHPGFGTGKDFWELKDVQNDAMVAQTVIVIESVQRDTPTREAVLEFLSRGDFIVDASSGAVGDAGTEEQVITLGNNAVVSVEEDVEDVEDVELEVEEEEEEGAEEEEAEAGEIYPEQEIHRPFKKAARKPQPPATPRVAKAPTAKPTKGSPTAKKVKRTGR